MLKHNLHSEVSVGLKILFSCAVYSDENAP